MGRLIDESILLSEIRLLYVGMPCFKPLREKWAKDNEQFLQCEKIISQLPTVEAIPKADYEARLKSDMAAMLTDLSMEIGEIEDGYTEFDEENKRSLTMIPLESVDRLIQQKINALKAD